MTFIRRFLFPALLAAASVCAATSAAPELRLNDLEYLEMPGLNVMLAHDYYPEGHQGGVGVILNGLRVATNGDLRLDRTPGQWDPVPKVGERQIDREKQEIRVHMQYPDPAKNRTGFNPVDYPDLEFGYTLRVRPEGAAFRILVDLDAPLPEAWIGKVGFNLELFPGLLFGQSYAMDGATGIFPLQANGPGALDAEGAYQIAALAKGRKLAIAPESDTQRMIIEDATGGGLELVDGRGQHTNGWFVVRSLVASGATQGAVNWLVSAHPQPGFMAAPTVQVSQVGYHPQQTKIAVVEIDPRDTARPPVTLSRIAPDGALETVLEAAGTEWGRFLRFNYLQFDFSGVTEPGMYLVRYGAARSNPFKIGPGVYQRGVWQPTLEYFLPVQMCHMRVNDLYRVWHGVCHLDDARMAPAPHLLFDGYEQGPSTLTPFKGGEHVPGLDRGGWHDAGDDDLRVESQAGTMFGLALAWEAFRPDHDDTTIDQANRLVEIHRPDGKPDILQQIEHGALSVVEGYKSMGRLYRGIITPTLDQYVMVGDFANQTDNVDFDPAAPADSVPPIGTGVAGSPDDRWVFTEENPRRELMTAADLAASHRVLKGFNDPLAADCLRIALELWKNTDENAPAASVPPWQKDFPNARINAAVELLITTGERTYADYLVSQQEAICANIRITTAHWRFPRLGWVVARAMPFIDDAGFKAAVAGALRDHHAYLEKLSHETPYGVPYRPDIWGAGWIIQDFGMQQYFLHTGFPDIFTAEPMLHALEFILGRHPGANTASFVSGVGSHSVTTAYGFNRADWSHIPGGSVSGTALIRPDFPELLEWPYLWQQTEYVLGGGTTDYLFLVLAADRLLNTP